MLYVTNVCKGYGAAGYSIFTNVTALVPGATGYPVHYPANWGGCASENKGIEDLLNNLKTMSTKCPNTKFALGGHSQGGVVTVRTITQIPPEILSKIVAVAMVGSPQCPANVKAKCKSFCNTGDSICTGDGGSAAAGRCGTGNGKTTRRSLVVPFEGLEIAGSPVEDDEATKLFKREVWKRAAPECAKIDSEAEHGHAVPGVTGTASHMAYNSDGFYVRAAACYVAKKFSGQ